MEEYPGGIPRRNTAEEYPGGIPISLALNLFDKRELLILTYMYGTEIWGTKYAGPIEATHRKYCKYILKVSSHLTHAMLQCWANLTDTACMFITFISVVSID